MYHIEAGLLLKLVKERGYTLHSFSKECGCDIETVNKFNDGKSIRKVKADKMWSALQILPLHHGDMTDDFKTLKY